MQNYTQEENSTDFPLQEEIFSVRDLNRLSKALLERHFADIWVKGEISNFARPRSGHIYFSLKDADAQIRCAMFKHAQRDIDFEVKDGIEVILQGTVSIYTDRGDYQLIASKMHLWGQGQLQQAFEALKEKLHKAGIFDKARKKPIPTFPNHIGIISSATGDALQDILRILKERYPIVPITVYPTQVQGKQAAPSIVTALALANQHQKADVLILARGGGSLEDLWGFNEEKVAEALFKSQIPIITGIGHEMDFTIADFVADLRAPTPTAAAQACVPDQNELKALFAEKKRILIKTVCRTLDYQQFRLDQLQKQLVHPQNKLNQNLEKLGFLKEKLSRSILNYLFLHESKINHLQNVLMYHSGQAQIQQWQQLLQQLNERLKRAVLQQLRFYETQFKQQVEKLQTLSPLQTLSRGYAIVSNEQGHTLNDVRTLKIGQKVQTRLATGAFTSVIEALDEQNHKK